MNPPQLLASGVQQLNIDANDEQLKLLLKFVQLLQKWNRAYNLTAIEDTREIISKHILDSLSAVEFLQGQHIIDVGSGAGLPGIPLAVICQDKEFTLLDSNAKKTRFIQQAVIDLGLKNVQIVQQRVEDYRPTDEPGVKLNSLISRAFVGSDKLLASCDHLFERGQIIFMLGKQKHLEALPKRYNVIKIHSVKIPLLEAQRHIALVQKS
jgi:16S rRNA (guanine527-N7)-methyltransferase